MFIVAEHWVDASRRHKMPVDEQIFFDIKDDVFSTHPACIAFETAKLQSEEMGKRYLRRLREAAAAERLQSSTLMFRWDWLMKSDWIMIFF